MLGFRMTLNKHDLYHENQIQSLNEHARLVEQELHKSTEAAPVSNTKLAGSVELVCSTKMPLFF